VTSSVARPTSRARVVRLILASFVFWTALGVFVASQLHFAGMPWGTALEWSLPRWYSWGLLAPCIFWLDWWTAGRWSVVLRLLVHVPMALAWTTAAILLRLVVRPLRGAPFPDDIGVFFSDRFFPDLAIYAAVAVVSLLRAHTRRLHEREQQARELAVSLERRLTEAQIQGLRAQLQPHFLFNALNTISAFTESDPRVARRLMEQLGDLLRASLAHTAHPLVSLGEELTFLDDYLAIESARFGERIVATVHADDAVLDVQVPSFLVQPLVENAIRHGVAPRLSGGTIEVTATPVGSSLVLAVRDNGVGLRPGWDMNSDAGVGLSNLRARLEHIYGRRDLLRIGNADGGGVEVTVTVPVIPPAHWATPASAGDWRG
jgi:signal transduction histidine kinase